MSKPTHEFRGKIAATTPDGRSGLVVLECKVLGKSHAVISPDTAGRVALMNGSGVLPKGRRVKGVAEKGHEALRAVSISASK